VTHLLHQTIDITERKQIEKETRAALDLIKLYRDQSPIATIGWDLNMEINDWNMAATDLFGYSEQEAKVADFKHRLVPDHSMTKVEASWTELMAGSPTKVVLETRAKDNHLLLSEWHTAPLIDHQERVIGVVSRVIDISAEHLAQQTLLAKENDQREILDSMMDAVMSIDLSGTVLSFNQAAIDLFEFTLDEAVGQSINQILSPPYIAQFEQFTERFKAGDFRPLGKSRDFVGQRKNGTTFPMRLTINALPDDGSGMPRFIGSCHDLSELKQHEEQLRRAQRMDALGMLTGGIAHDFNNMLGVVIGYAGMLERKLSTQPKLKKNAGQILRAAQRGASLTRKLLAFSRHGEQGELAANRVDLNLLVHDQIEMLQKTLTVRIALNIDLSDDTWPVWLDSHDLEDAVLNICVNASHAMSDPSAVARLTIRTSNLILAHTEARKLGISGGDYVLLTVTDTGIGMDEETKELIFDPFFSTKGEEGTGLGLSQVFGFVSRAKGAIEVHSTPGVGTEFVIYFPRHREDGAPAIEPPVHQADSPPSIPPSITEQKRILVVDDEPDLRELTAELFSEQGYQVYCAENYDQAVIELEKHEIDLLYCDVVMPGNDGYQLAEMVQKKHPTVKIQMTSGFTNDRQMNITDQSLHENILYKPVDANRMLNRVRNLLG